MRDEHIVSTLFQPQTKLAEAVGNDAQVVPRDILYGQFAARHGCNPNETAYLDHVGEDAMMRTAQMANTLDGQQVGGNASDFRSHLIQHSA